ncbi:unnamed protein product [Eruca vesicaria subsp. sativa]|uniref:SANTA domain-containing protein n=1 Tax=Eruca vesicaria subsp. sativa TaxID=29727 RepID=A0ABC8JUV8_ERUVS|nr:unnamed protein product [Eruca vesicaria subsp. sativa]
MATKPKLQPLSARRSSPRTRSGAVPEPISTPNSDEIPRTPFSSKAITPLSGTQESVSLSEWWLKRKANGKGLGVEGFGTIGESTVTQRFSLATISTRHDITTLETSDAVTVSLSGIIDQSLSVENGVSSEVCNRFLLGFPCDWKDYIEEGFVEEEKDYGVSFSDIPVNRMDDVLATASPCFLDEIMGYAVDNLRDLLHPGGTGKPDKERHKARKECERSVKECRTPRRDGGDEKRLVLSDEGVKTRGMLRSREEDETERHKKPRKECESSVKGTPRRDGGDEKRLVLSDEGVKTRGMLRWREECEAERNKPRKECERSVKDCRTPRRDGGDEKCLVLSDG